MSQAPIFDKLVWQKKAMAFVTRSHRHLWGKNNEDPQAFLFTRGLKNQFMKNMLIGWNKFGQERPMKNWGAAPPQHQDKKIFLPSGIVIPGIVEKKLKAVFITPYDGKSPALVVPGSQAPSLTLSGRSGTAAGKIVVVQNLIDALFLFQEAGSSCRVIAHPDPDLPLAPYHTSLIKAADDVVVFSSGQNETADNQRLFLDFPGIRFYPYHSKEDLLRQCLMH